MPGIICLYGKYLPQYMAEFLFNKYVKEDKAEELGSCFCGIYIAWSKCK